MVQETFGQRLQRLRQAAGLSKPKLAAAAGVPIDSLANCEQDQGLPLVDAASLVAQALGISLDDLAGSQASTNWTSSNSGKEEYVAAAPSTPAAAALESEAKKPHGQNNPA